MSGIVDILETALGKETVIRGRDMDRATSYWDPSPAKARALLLPRTTAEVSEALRLCFEHNQPVVTQGGMTNCVAAADAGDDEVILSLERMAAIESIDVTGGTAMVGAGVVLQTLQEACLDKGMLFPLDLGVRGSCTLGGNAATNAGGINVLRYGMTRNLVLGMEVVLADGTILSSLNRMLKNNAGYDLKQLFIGTEGTLGVITRLVVKLFPRPKTCCSALVALEDFDRVTALLRCARSDLADTLSAFEVMWGNYFSGVTGEQGHRAPLSRDHAYYVMLEAEGGEPGTDEDRFNRLLESSYEHGLIVDAVIPKSESERIALWNIREHFDPILDPKPVFLYDISLPIVDMEHYVNTVGSQLRTRWSDCEFYILGHIADGNLHFFIRPKAKSTTLHHECDDIVYGVLKDFSGSISAEHGIGIEKVNWLSHCRTQAELKLMKQIKQTLDSKNILNRGRVLGDMV
jgi:FAD/FMN-containing dehydrogenase